MVRYYGTTKPPSCFSTLKIGGSCPHCSTVAKFTVVTAQNFELIARDKLDVFIAGYACDACSGAIGIRWKIFGWHTAHDPVVSEAEIVGRARESFHFGHVPTAVEKVISEALDCLSVDSYNGFAALCRRMVQAISTDLGADATSKVKHQIEEMADLTDLNDDFRELAVQIMLCGHDGSHPHLPEVDEARATVLLSLLQDLVYQLYTRPGKVREAASLRTEAIERTES